MFAFSHPEPDGKNDLSLFTDFRVQQWEVPCVGFTLEDGDACRAVLTNSEKRRCDLRGPRGTKPLWKFGYESEIYTQCGFTVWLKYFFLLEIFT